MGHISENVGATGFSIKQFEFFSTGLQLTISLAIVDTFWPK